MPESMTGFGQAQATADGIDVVVELRSVNHRHLDLRFKMPSDLQPLQRDLTRTLKTTIERGHVEVRVHVGRDQQTAPQVGVDLSLAKAWYAALSQVSEALDLAHGPDLRTIAMQPGIMTVQRPEEDADKVKPLVLAALSQAATELQRSRQTEGAALAADLTGRVATLRALQAELDDLSADVVVQQRARLHERVAKALKAVGQELDPARVAQEVVLLSDKSDITEELVRVRGHLDAVQAALSEERPGKRLGFLAQELLREFNTVGSKSGALAITERVVAAKVELEKVREQVLNLA
ncbi:MAG: YicC family protein [Myxococcales bacterium]|nr:YicC family protein [Myxococcales bacterium]